MHRICVTLIWLVSISYLTGQSSEQWVDSLYQKMSLEEKVGQLFMVRAYSKKDNADVKKIESYIDKYHIGGICFFQGDPTHQASLINKYQNRAKTPILVAIDGEWGLGMRFKEKAISYPRQLMLGAIQDNNVIYDMGREVASQLKRIGVHVNFAPVVDVNNNPDNPVINDRSFGEDKYNVIAKSYAYMKGMQDMGVMACMKHFPGHGDTDVDSHLDLPVMHHSQHRLDSVELAPFRALSKQGMSSTMIAHLHIPSIDARPHRPTTLSKNAVTTLLKDSLSFAGLIYTDAMDMKGVAKHFPDGKADLEAFLAGVDVILLPNDLKKGVETLLAAVKDGTVSRERLAHSVKKILRAKYTAGLANKTMLDLNGISTYINSPRALALKEKLIEQSITLAKDSLGMVPIKNIENHKITTIAIGAKGVTPFQSQVNRYTSTTHTQLSKTYTADHARLLKRKAGESDIVVVNFHDMSKYASKSWGIDSGYLPVLRELDKAGKLIVVLHGSPYALELFDGFKEVVVAYNDEDITQKITAQSLFGANPIKGKLPVTASQYYKHGQGEYRSSLGRLGWSMPERVGMSSDILLSIDSLAEEMIAKKAAPGGQVLIAKDGKVVWEKAYGYHTYKKQRRTQTDDIYDVASVTKICASTISLMQLYDDNKLDLNASLSRYLSTEVDTCNKKDINIRAMLAHHAQLAGWIPFYTKTMSKSKKNPKPLDKYYSKVKKEGFTIPVAKDLYLRSDYRDSIYSRIYASDLKDKAQYKYSDLSFYMFHKIIERQTGMELEDYTFENIYKPLGLKRTGYLPLERHSRYDIAPTEEDAYFRKQRLQGHVHDMGAAMLGGVAGHAGLFSNAYEIGVIMQMLLNEGSYGGKQYVEPSTVRTFTQRYHASTRRGLGFDMKELTPNKYMNVSELASASAFGHLGFTGVSAFADPEYDLVFIFITNRTYPSMNNKKFAKDNYRPKMQSIAYKAMMNTITRP